MAALPARVLFGAAYYHEYQPYERPAERLKTDLDLMADAHVSVIRVGESVWSTWEPENGKFDLDWLQPVLDGAHERGISVVLGTPTYAAPPWLARQYPEITGERRTGERIGWGARQEVDFTHPAFRFHAERIIRKVVGRYADHPAVIGFQVDNEPGLHLFHNQGVFQRFVDHLREKYGDVETLNREWGLVYWSHRLSTWADLWTPDGNEQPQYDVAWREFQARQVTEFIGWQADLVREYAGPEQFVTTCISYTRQGVEDDELTDRLDIASGNPYYDMQDGLLLPDPTPDDHEQKWKTTGVWSLYQTADWMFSSRQEPFLVTETNAGSIGMAWDNRPGYDGQWRQAAWALVSRGARMIEYWHWHTLHFGAETYWGGILPHTGQPGRTYAELARLGAEFEAATSSPDSNRTPTSRWCTRRPASGSCRSTRRSPSRTASRTPPPTTASSTPSTAAPSTRAARSASSTPASCTTRAASARVSPRGGRAPPPGPRRPGVVHRRRLHPRLARRLRPRGRPPRPRPAHRLRRPRGPRPRRAGPGRLTEAAGVGYDEFGNLAREVPVRPVPGGPLRLPESATATRWAEGLTATDADVLVTYDHPHFGRWPAVTTRRHGAGRVTCVGTVPGRDLGRALAEWLTPSARHAWGDLPPSVTATTGTSPDGRRVHIVHNWAWEPARVPVPASLADVLTGTSLPAGAPLELGPWDVRVLVSTNPSTTSEA